MSWFNKTPAEKLLEVSNQATWDWMGVANDYSKMVDNLKFENARYRVALMDIKDIPGENKYENAESVCFRMKERAEKALGNWPGKLAT